MLSAIIFKHEEGQHKMNRYILTEVLTFPWPSFQEF